MYDPAGNTTSFNSQTFTYNQRGRISQLTGGAGSVAYHYNGLGEMIEKTGIGGTQRFFYDESGHMVTEYGASGSLIEETIWMGNTPVAVIQPSGTSVAVFYIHTDHLNTPRKITRSSDNGLMWRWDPDTYGLPQSNNNPAGLGSFTYNLRFAGQYFHNESWLHTNYFRTYNPQTGRYLESDPIGLAGGINTYAYVSDSPVNAVDPTGLLELCRAGLDALNGNDVGPLHHEFMCWTGADGKEVCRGYGRDQMSSIAKAVLGKVDGRILKDGENKTKNSTSCGTDDKNSCMDDCASKEWSKLEKTTPKYGLITGASCQSINRSVLQKCEAQCKAPTLLLPVPNHGSTVQRSSVHKERRWRGP